MTDWSQRDCLHCGLPVTGTLMPEFTVITTRPRLVSIWTHKDSGHERCANGVTLAEPAPTQQLEQE